MFDVYCTTIQFILVRFVLSNGSLSDTTSLKCAISLNLSRVTVASITRSELNYPPRITNSTEHYLQPKNKRNIFFQNAKNFGNNSIFSDSVFYYLLIACGVRFHSFGYFILITIIYEKCSSVVSYNDVKLLICHLIVGIIFSSFFALRTDLHDSQVTRKNFYSSSSG